MFPLARCIGFVPQSGHTRPVARFSFVISDTGRLHIIYLLYKSIFFAGLPEL